jgi:Kef-type K+ transport system membrane component KefB
MSGRNTAFHCSFGKHSLLLLVVTGVLLASPYCFGAGASPHSGQTGNVLLALIVILIVSRVGGELAVRIGQPAVLGELVLGIIAGNLSLIGFRGIDFIKSNEFIDILAQVGVVLLLFDVGLESRLSEMRKVGLSSFLAATFGVIAPFLLGWGVAKLFLPQESEYVHIFIGAILCATSVGITARVFQDLKLVETPEAQIVLGAAVIDDVLGLIVLAVVQGLVVAAGGGGSLTAASILLIILKATAFLIGGLLIGVWTAPRLFRVVSLMRIQGLLLGSGLVFCFVFAYAADRVGLAPIVGAFTAGLILEEVHFVELARREERSLHDLLSPIMSFLVPVFFVLMGMHVDVRVFSHVGVLGFALVLTVAAALGKQACGLGVLQKGVNRLAVGLGMIPRGEVGLIFAHVGAQLVISGHRVVNVATYSAVVIMVILTTLFAPPLLKWALLRGSRGPKQTNVQVKASSNEG